MTPDQARKLRILGVKVDRVDHGRALEHVAAFLDTPGCKQIVTLNPEYVMLAERSPDLRRIILDADLVVPDGMGIVWASRLLGEPLKGRVTGTGLLPEICRVGAVRGRSIYFLGGKPGIAAQAATVITTKLPDVQVAGVSASDPDPRTDLNTVAAINASGAEILAVAYGCPKQDFWIDRNRNSLENVKVAIGVGGAFDFISGQIPRAPKLMQRAGLEWLFRLWLEPSRGRRMAALPKFGWQVLRSRKK